MTTRKSKPTPESAPAPDATPDTDNALGEVLDLDAPVIKRPRGRKPTEYDDMIAGMEIDGRAKGIRRPVSELSKVRSRLTSAGNACNPPRTVNWYVSTGNKRDDGSYEPLPKGKDGKGWGVPNDTVALVIITVKAKTKHDKENGDDGDANGL